MGVRMHIEVDYKGDPFSDYSPIIQRTHGKPLYAFLIGLEFYCGEAKENGSSILQEVFDRYQRLDQTQSESLCTACQPLLGCMWYEAGFSTAYQLEQYELFKQENPDLPFELTKEVFQQMLEADKKHWQSIDDVLRSVSFLLSVFRQASPELIEGFFAPEHTIPDFEALEADLNFLIKQGHTTVRLTFS